MKLNGRTGFHCLATITLFLAMTISMAAQATCLKWDLNGAWIFVQSNGTDAELDIQQSGNQIKGRADYTEFGPEGGMDIYWNGLMDGTIEGDQLLITVYWDDATIGVYQGTVNPDGSLTGGAYDKRNPATRASWHGNRKAACMLRSDRLSAGGLTSAPTATTPRGADGKPAVALGRVKTVPASGQCQRWNVGGTLRLTQSNTLLWMTLELQQSGPSFAGTATYLEDKGMERAKRVDGNILGTVSGNAINFTAAWDNGTTGIYNGAIAASGRVTGHGYQKENPAESSDWSILELASCDSIPAAARTGRELGRVKIADPSGPSPTICEASRSARARNSPAAPGLEAQCRQAEAARNVPVSTLVDQDELDRLAAIGSAIARADFSVGNSRRSSTDPQFRFGFDVGTALFGDPAMGAQGKTALDPGSLNIRASLNPAAWPGFDVSRDFHFSRDYGP